MISWRVFFRDKNCTLNGYVFSDEAHARVWLTQGFIIPATTLVQQVEVGDLTVCRMCGGTGYHQKISSIGDKIPLKQFLDNSPTQQSIEAARERGDG